MLLAERVDELEDAARLSRAEEWQRAEAWTTWERMKAGDVREASQAQIDLDFEAARAQARFALRPSWVGASAIMATSGPTFEHSSSGS